MCSPGGNQVRFCEAKVGPDRVKPTQLRFVELALRFHRLEEFTIIEVAGPSLRVRAEAAPEPARDYLPDG